MAANKWKSHNNQPKACQCNKGGEEGELQPARGAWGKRESIVWGRLSWIVYQINIKLMCLLKKIISPPDHRINKKPRTPPSDNLLQREYLEGIGWLPIAMLLGPANGGFTMVRHVWGVREGALPSNHTIPTLSLFPCFKYKHSKNKVLHVLQMV